MRALHWQARLIMIGWIFGFLVGTTTHTLDILTGGTAVYAAFPLGVRIFWISLVLLDPAVVLLLLLRQRVGVVSGVLVMVSDLVVNLAVALGIGGLSIFGLVSQIAFGLFVIVTAPFLWRAEETVNHATR
jgi:hypothetical protein